jgi:prephenate dehydrogenase
VISPFPHTVGIVGVGLVGGSLAYALRASPDRPRIIAIDRDKSTREQISAARVADRVLASTENDALGECDVVVLAAPVAAIETLLGPVSRRMRDGAVLTDLAGVKRSIIASARASVRPTVAFVGAHPMFGGERGGFTSASHNAWSGGTVAVCTDGEPTAVERIVEFHRTLGAEVVQCTAAQHDEAMAAVSHLPFVVASALALVARDAGPLAEKLAGRGLRSMTRLAAFSYDVQGEVARRNSSLGPAIERLQGELARLGAVLEGRGGGSGQAARRAFEEARAAKDKLK